VKIEDVRVGDLVLSRDEHSPDGVVVAKEVEEVFVRQGLITHLHLPNGVVIRTTAEHPFFVAGRGWVPCNQLKVGDLLLCEDGTWVPVEDLFETGEWETVYNVRVKEYHTYFVGTEEWGFAVWAHNNYEGFLLEARATDSPLFSAAYETALRGSTNRDGWHAFRRTMLALGVDDSRITWAWKVVLDDRLVLQRAGIDPTLLESHRTVDPELNTTASTEFLNYVLKTRTGVVPIVGTGGDGKLYLMLKEYRPDGLDYIGRTAKPTVQNRMTQHQATMPEGYTAEGVQIARSLSEAESLAMETILIEQGRSQLGNRRVERLATRPDYPQIVAPGYALLRYWLAKRLG
jgi:hypothetical protein